jgi:tRNA (cytosine49-C5)-methyltransferase
MAIPPKLLERLKLLSIPESVYEMRSRKCFLSRQPRKNRVPWFEHAYYAPEEFTSEESPIFDPVSLVPCIALNPQKGDRVLDVCAAPGTKTFILSFLAPEAIITANDVDRFRVKRLTANADRYNINCAISNISGRLIEGSFNKILVDAPCSGEGMINKLEKVFWHWSERRIKFLAKRQKKLIKRAFEVLETGGTLVYSTCTFAPEENEGVIDFLLNKNDNAVMQDIGVDINHTPGVTSWNGVEFNKEVTKCIRIYPQMNNTGGFFTAKIKKA